MKNILIMIDVQNGFVKTDCAERTFINVKELAERRLFDVVIATKYWNYKGSNISRLMNWNDLCTEEEQALRPEIAEFADHIVMKDVYSGVTPELMELLLEINDGYLPEHVWILGFDTECCVLMTAVDFFELGIRPLIIEQCCGSHDGEYYHNGGIASLEHLIGDKFIIKEELTDRETIEEIAERCLFNPGRDK